MRRFLIFGLILLSGLSAACNVPPLPAAPSGKLNVIATHSILADFVQNVGQEKIALKTLVGPGQDTHTYEPTPADGAALAEANLIFENGLGFETWLDDLYTASGSTARRVIVTEAIEPLAAEEQAEAETEAGAHEHDEFDPHVWHSVTHAIQMVKNIRDALVKADAANASAYQTNAEVYLQQLQELDSWVFSQVNRLPAERRKLVTTHDTFSYFAARYGFEVIGAILPVSTEGASPSAQELARLVETIQAQNVPAVFAENISSNALLNQIAAEAGVEVIPSLFTDSLGPTGSEGATYIQMVRSNVQTIVGALQP